MASANPFALLGSGGGSGGDRSAGAGTSGAAAGGSSNAGSEQTSKKKKNRGGKKRRSRRKSFAVPNATDDEARPSSAKKTSQSPDARGPPDFYMHGRNLSNTSLESEALLDHRHHPWGSRPRRPSTLVASQHNKTRDSQPRLRTVRGSGRREDGDEQEGDEFEAADRQLSESTPLLSSSAARHEMDHRAYGSSDGMGSRGGRARHDSIHHRESSRSSWGRPGQFAPTTPGAERYNVNYPPSMPGSPRLTGELDRLDMNFGDELMRDQLESSSKDDAASLPDVETSSQRMQGSPAFPRRHTIAMQAEEDVCFPQEGMSEIADDDTRHSQNDRSQRRPRRRRGKWPDLAVLEEWSRLEREDRSQEQRIKKITEPQLVNGRLRPTRKGWCRTEEDAPYRFTYFNEEFQSTIHSQTISELVQPDSSFRDLFIPERPVLSDTSDSEDDEEDDRVPAMNSHFSSSLRVGEPNSKGRAPSVAVSTQSASEPAGEGLASPHKAPSKNSSGEATPVGTKSPAVPAAPPGAVKPNSPLPPMPPKPVRYGDRPVWWLDVLSPTEAEMKVIQRAFGIHPLTTEDIMLQEQREKVELFRHYYFVNYRSFDQDTESETHMEPVNLYMVVFREGVISFHFQQTPHPANVRRRIRQLKDYMVLSADWISYAIVDDITDVFVPLIQNIEDEVDDIDDDILKMHTSNDSESKTGRFKDEHGDDNEKSSLCGSTNADVSDGDMLKRVGECRKKVMTLYRFLGNKADVIKGFAKRCNEHYQVAPRSEIGLYLGDIQDHIVTMTANLSHYEV